MISWDCIRYQMWLTRCLICLNPKTYCNGCDRRGSAIFAYGIIRCTVSFKTQSVPFTYINKINTLQWRSQVWSIARGTGCRATKILVNVTVDFELLAMAVYIYMLYGIMVVWFRCQSGLNKYTRMHFKGGDI